MLTSLVPSGAQQGERGQTRFQAGSQQHYHSPPDPPVLNSTSNFSTVSWTAYQQMNEADKDKASYDEAAALNEILQEWNADETIDFAGMERGTCADHPQLWDRSSLLVSPNNHCATSVGSSEGVGTLGITFMPSFQSNIASRDNQQAGLEGSYTNLQGKRRMALPYIPDPGFGFLPTRSSSISSASQLNTPIVTGHHTNNTIDKNNISSSSRNNGIVPTTADSLWESVAEIEKNLYFNSAVDCCIGCTSGAGAAQNKIHHQPEKSMFPPLYICKSQQSSQIACTSMENGYNFNWNGNYFNAYDTLSKSSSESLMWFVPNPLTPTRDILPSVQVKVDEKQKVVVNSDNINPSTSLGFDSAANVRAIRKRRNMSRKRRWNFATPTSLETLTQGFQPEPPLATWDSFSLTVGTSSVASATGRPKLHKPQGRHDRGAAATPDDPDCNGKDHKIKNLKFLFQKELRNSDVGSLGRMVLPKKEAEANLPILTEREGMQLCMEDMYLSKNWNFKYRYWPNNKSRMYVMENTGEFVKTHRLRLGDFIMFYKDERNEKYIVRAKKVMSELMITSGNSVDQAMITSSNSVDQTGTYSSPTLIEERSNQQSTSDKENEVSCESPYGSGNSVSIDDTKMALVTVEDIFSKEFNIEFPPDIADSVHLESIPSFGSDEISLEDFIN